MSILKGLEKCTGSVLIIVTFSLVNGNTIHSVTTLKFWLSLTPIPVS